LSHNKESAFFGHLMALITACIWGCTFVSSKVLLRSFTPVVIIVFRFALAYIALWIISPRLLRVRDFKTELLFAFAGLCGVSLYFLGENIALTCTQASNVGIIISVSPLFTAVLSAVLGYGDRPTGRFYAGFIISLIGISIITLNGTFVLKISPKGDLLTVCAALSWAVYSIVMMRIGKKGYGTLLSTRRVFFYGLVFMVPALFVMGFSPDLSLLKAPENIINLLFLGVIASALCYIMWNRAFKILGAVRTNVYIYIIPVVTIIASAVILKERITWISAAGSALTLGGLYLSQSKRKVKTNARQK
jgi:drug/metabolite transporter (DMT)-like permease